MSMKAVPISENGRTARGNARRVTRPGEPVTAATENVVLLAKNVQGTSAEKANTAYGAPPVSTLATPLKTMVAIPRVSSGGRIAQPNPTRLCR